MKSRTYSITVAVILILVAIIVFQNLDPVPIKLFFWRPEFPAAVLAVAVFILGFFAGIFTNIWKRKK